jgi:hypothetical protein
MLSAQIKRYKSRFVNSGNSNGERISNVQISPGIRNNFFPLVSTAERLAGKTDYKKHFIKFASPTNELISIATLFLSAPTTLTDSKSYLFNATQRDQQGDIVGTERKYATGLLHADILAGATSLAVDFETGMGALLVVQAGDKLVMADAATIDFKTVASVVWTGDQAAITLTTGCDYDHLASNTYVGSCIEKTNVAANYDDFAITSVAGTYDDTTYPIELNSIGTDEETITLTKGAANAFTVLSDIRGALPAGDVTVDYEPNNPDFSEPLFMLRAAGWGGTWLAGDIISFKIHPCAIPVWQCYMVSAGATQTGTDITDIRVVAEV